MMSWENWLTQWQVTTLLIVQHMLVLWKSWLTVASYYFTHCTTYDVMRKLAHSVASYYFTHCTAYAGFVKKLAHSVASYYFTHCTTYDVVRKLAHSVASHCTAYVGFVRELAHSVPNYNFRSLYNAWCNTRSLHNTWYHSKKTGSPEGKLLFLSLCSTWCHKVRTLAVLTSGYYFKSLNNTCHIWESLITWCMLTWWAKHSLRRLA